MAVASPRLERYAAIAALPACAAGTAVSADIIYTELNTTIYNETTSFEMAGASVLISAYNFNYIVSDTYVFDGLNYLDAIISGGAIALGSGFSLFSAFRTARGFAAGEEIGAGANFGEASSWANLAATSVFYGKTSSGGDWQNLFDDTRLFLGVAIDNGSDVNYGWIDVSWSGVTGATIHGYAYETDVNTAIIAGATEGSGPVVPGAPTAVGLVGLAAGAAGIRRKRSA